MNSKHYKCLTLALLIFSAVAGFSQTWESAQIDQIASIKFPATPKDIPIDSTSTELMAQDANGVYIAMVVKMDGYTVNTQDSLTSFYGEVRTGMQTTANMTDIHSKDFMFNGKRGLEMDYKLPNDAFGRSRVLLLAGNLYSYSIITADAGNLRSATSSKFFESFTAK